MTHLLWYYYFSFTVFAEFFWSTFLLIIVALLFMTLFRHSYTIINWNWVSPTFSLLFSLNSFEKIGCLLSRLGYCSSDLESASLSVTLFGNAAKSFSKFIRGTCWILRFSFPNVPIIFSNVLKFYFFSVILLLKFWGDGHKFFS